MQTTTTTTLDTFFTRLWLFGVAGLWTAWLEGAQAEVGGEWGFGQL